MSLRDTKVTAASKAFAEMLLTQINLEPHTLSLDDMTRFVFLYLMREVDGLQSQRTTVFPGICLSLSAPTDGNRPDPDRCVNIKEWGQHSFSHDQGRYGKGVPVCRNCGAWFSGDLSGYAVPTFEEELGSTIDLLRPGVAERRHTFARPITEHEEMQIYALAHKARLTGGIPALSKEFNRLLDDLAKAPPKED